MKRLISVRELVKSTCQSMRTCKGDTTGGSRACLLLVLLRNIAIIVSRCMSSHAAHKEKTEVRWWWWYDDTMLLSHFGHQGVPHGLYSASQMKACLVFAPLSLALGPFSIVGKVWVSFETQALIFDVLICWLWSSHFLFSRGETKTKLVEKSTLE